eukprot:TRINITY_DN41364_c0_g1_i1.p1 TRINITY_DN41364_c0_g1~~TRINITY_DN41364_c0_g1_i1.p1  ORF type:complete len:252 (-),score=29.52 TRINITY_DN41364_c0_g1_i1:34-789(-)
MFFLLQILYMLMQMNSTGTTQGKGATNLLNLQKKAQAFQKIMMLTTQVIPKKKQFIQPLMKVMKMEILVKYQISQKRQKFLLLFFVTKPYITSQPDLIKRMTAEGHIVGNHSVHHPSMPSINDPDKFKEEFTGVEEAYKEITNLDMPKYFRPPMGKYSEKSLEMTKNLGYKTIFWSFAYKDWLIKDQPAQEYAIKKISDGAHPGCIMLLHAVSDTNTNVLKTVLENLKADGYVFKSLDELAIQYNIYFIIF